MVDMLRASIFVCSVTLLWAKAVPGSQTGATSFIYRRDNNGPATYVQIGVETQLPEFHQESLENTPIPLAEAPLQEVAPVSGARAVNSYGIVHEHRTIDKPIEEPHGDDSDESNSVSESDEQNANATDDHHEYGDANDDDNIGDTSQEDEEFYSDRLGDPDDVIDYGLNSGIGHKEIGSNLHVQSGGSDYSAERHSSRGEKGEKDYNSQHKFHKGKKGEHKSEGHERFFSKGAEDEGIHFDETEKDGSHKEFTKGSRVGDFDKMEKHSKRSKLDGFHDEYHKDEYNKDREFYNGADSRGHFNKHAKKASKNGSEHGGRRNDRVASSGLSQDSIDKEGFIEGGEHQSSDEGYIRKVGGDDFFDNFEDFHKKAGISDVRKHSYGGSDSN